MDVAYYQRHTQDNRLRRICETVRAGLDEEHCVSEPTLLDARRTALFIGALLEEPGVRVVGIDGRAAPPILAAFSSLCAAGWIRPWACRPERIKYETHDQQHGWFRFHHAHLHVGWAR